MGGVCGGPRRCPTMEPGGNGFGVPLEASLARQLLLLEPADYDFSGDRTQRALPSPAEKREGVWEGQEGGDGGREATVRMNKRGAHTHACGEDAMSQVLEDTSQILMYQL